MTKFGLGQGISCHDRVFYVETEFGQDQGLFLSRLGIFMSRQSSGKGKKVSCHDSIFLGRDKLWLRQRASCRDKVFCVATRCG